MNEILRRCAPQNDIKQEPVMLNPFGFAQAKLREASRSLNRGLVLSWNEILRLYSPQNDNPARGLSSSIQ